MTTSNSTSFNLTRDELLLGALRLIGKSGRGKTASSADISDAAEALESFELPEDDRNIIVEVHYYSPHRFTHQGASWSKGSDEWIGMTWRGTPEEKQAVMDDFQIAIDWAEKHNRPLYLGEFGVYEKADMESRAAWLQFVVETAEKNNFSWGIWNLMGTSFGIYDPSQKSWIEPLKNAILPKE